VRNLLQTRGPAATVCRQRDEVERRVAQRTEDLALARVEALERLARTAEFATTPPVSTPDVSGAPRRCWRASCAWRPTRSSGSRSRRRCTTSA
jgi:hypothetical protein